MTYNAPTLGQTFDRLRWELTLHTLDSCYSLAIKHDACETQFTFTEWDMGDATELLSEADWNERVGNIRTHEDMSHDDAVYALQAHARIMRGAEADIREHLRRHWDALTLLVRPAIL
jgi:hypothetical protein